MPLCFSLKIIVLIKEHTHACMHTHTHTHAPLLNLIAVLPLSGAIEKGT